MNTIIFKNELGGCCPILGVFVEVVARVLLL
jgi:hypothetical protein